MELRPNNKLVITQRPISLFVARIHTTLGVLLGTTGRHEDNLSIYYIQVLDSVSSVDCSDSLCIATGYISEVSKGKFVTS